MRVGHSYKQVELRGPFDAIVIGSGIGGLSCASLLARHGNKRVLVLERHYTAGGFTHSFERPGYDWDVGVHYVGAMHSQKSPIRRLFDHLTDEQLKWADLGEVYDEIIVEGDRYEFARGRAAFKKRMHGYFPKERDVIDEYVELTHKVARSSELFFADRGLPGALAELTGPLLRMPGAKFARATTNEVFDKLGMSPRLRSVLCGNFGDYGLPPSQSSFMMQAMLADHFRHGGFYPVGGASRIAATIIPSIERAGGAVVTSAPVAQILVEKGRAVGVRLENGDDLRAPIVVSDAGVRITFERLLSHETRSQLGLYEPLRDISASVSSVTLYLGFEGTPEELGMPRHNLWIYAQEDHDRAFEWVTKNRALPPRSQPLPLAYCSFAAARDPDFQRRHPGHATAEVITVSNHRWFGDWQDTPWHKRGEAYEAVKADWTERLLAPLLQRLPQLQSRIRHMELSTPLSTRHFASHLEGEIYGLAHSPRRFTHPRLRAETPIKGLFLAGSDIVTCGVAGGAAGGALAAGRILASDVRGLFRSRPASVAPGYTLRRPERVAEQAAAE